jgi:hypothetical protein
MRPQCSPCAESTGLFRDCEYAKRGSHTHRQQLEERVALLQAHLKDLERPNDADSVKLYDPYPFAAHASAISGPEVSFRAEKCRQ